ncbi:hypothetical protein QJQ45_024111, partial [Haematococcus lacustris]
GGSLSTPDPGAILSHTFEDDLGAGPLTYLATGQLLRRSTPLVAGVLVSQQQRLGSHYYCAPLALALALTLTLALALALALTLALTLTLVSSALSACPAGSGGQVGSLAQRCAVLAWLLEPSQRELCEGLLHCLLLNGGANPLLALLLAWQAERLQERQQQEQQQEQQQQGRPPPPPTSDLPPSTQALPTQSALACSPAGGTGQAGRGSGREGQAVGCPGVPGWLPLLDLQLQDCGGLTALDMALSTANWEAAELLVRAGALQVGCAAMRKARADVASLLPLTSGSSSGEGAMGGAQLPASVGALLPQLLDRLPLRVRDRLAFLLPPGDALTASIEQQVAGAADQQPAGAGAPQAAAAEGAAGVGAGAGVLKREGSAGVGVLGGGAGSQAQALEPEAVLQLIQAGIDQVAEVLQVDSSTALQLLAAQQYDVDATLETNYMMKYLTSARAASGQAPDPTAALQGGSLLPSPAMSPDASPSAAAAAAGSEEETYPVHALGGFDGEQGGEGGRGRQAGSGPEPVLGQQQQQQGQEGEQLQRHGQQGQQQHAQHSSRWYARWREQGRGQTEPGSDACHTAGYSTGDSCTTQKTHPDQQSSSHSAPDASVRSTAAPVAQPVTPVATCLVCYEACPVATFSLHLPCDHTTCDDCWRGILQARIDDGDVYRAACPEPDCCAPLPPDLMGRVLPASLLKRAENQLAQHFVHQHPHSTWCPRPGCGRSVHVRGRSAAQRGFAVQCTCGTRFCFECGASPPHEPASCEQVRTWRALVAVDSQAGELDTRRFLDMQTRSCPKCKMPILKDGGCNHMVCTQCRHHWCWVCGGPWEQHSAATGGYYACNRYTASPGPGAGQGAGGGAGTPTAPPSGRSAASRTLTAAQRHKLHHHLSRHLVYLGGERRTAALLSHMAWLASLGQSGAPSSPTPTPQAAAAAAGSGMEGRDGVGGGLAGPAAAPLAGISPSPTPSAAACVGAGGGGPDSVRGAAGGAAAGGAPELTGSPAADQGPKGPGQAAGGEARAGLFQAWLQGIQLSREVLAWSYALSYQVTLTGPRRYLEHKQSQLIALLEQLNLPIDRLPHAASTLRPAPPPPSSPPSHSVTHMSARAAHRGRGWGWSRPGTQTPRSTPAASAQASQVAERQAGVGQGGGGGAGVAGRELLQPAPPAVRWRAGPGAVQVVECSTLLTEQLAYVVELLELQEATLWALLAEVAGHCGGGGLSMRGEGTGTEAQRLRESIILVARTGHFERAEFELSMARSRQGAPTATSTALAAVGHAAVHIGSSLAQLAVKEGLRLLGSLARMR